MKERIKRGKMGRRKERNGTEGTAEEEEDVLNMREVNRERESEKGRARKK